MDKPSFEASLRALARRRAQERHPEPSELAAYHAGELTEDQEEKIQDHLTICEECAQLLLGLSEYSRFQPSQDTDAAADDQSAAAWQRFQARLREEEEPAAATREEAPSAPVVPLQRRRTSLWQRPGVAWAVAAGLALCVVGVGLRVGSLQKENKGLIMSQASSPIVDLAANVVRGANVTEVEEIRGNNPMLLLQLPGGGESGAEYEVDVVRSGSAQPLVGPERRPLDEDGSVHFDLTRRPLPPGDYVVRVYGAGEGRPLIVELPFRILR